MLIGSVESNFATPGQAAYSGAKAAVVQMGKTLAHELGGQGITLNTVQPGWIGTSGEASATGHSGEYTADEAASIPARRVGRPKDVGAAVAFLCSPEADYVNGTVLTVDGGMTAALALPEPRL